MTEARKRWKPVSGHIPGQEASYIGSQKNSGGKWLHAAEVNMKKHIHHITVAITPCRKASRMAVGLQRKLS